MKELETITIKDYLIGKGIEIIRESGKEIIIKCLFNSCDNDSKGNEAHLYINKETKQFYCHKCGESGNFLKLAKYFGDDFGNKNRYKKLADAMQIWGSASAPTNDFPYLMKKKILPHNSRLYDGCLVLPLYFSDGTLSSLQFIDESGDKKFLTGSKVAGCYSVIGKPDNTLCIAEGFATAASVVEATGYATAIAFSSNNLKAVAKDVKHKYPKTEIIICGDAEAVGSQKAREAAEFIGAKLALPTFETNENIDGKTPSDFNDLFVLRGSSAVQSSIVSAITIPTKFGFTPLNELLNEAEEEVNWVVDDLLPSGGFSVIIAKPKVGKSTLARQIALSVAQGEPFLGRQTMKGAVLYVSLEEKRSEVKSHFQLMGATGTEDLGVYIGSIPEDANEWLKSEIERKKPVLVIVDTLFRFARVADVNDYSKVITALDPLLALARTHSAHLMGVHHARKSGGDGADTTLGSTAIFGSVDTAIVMKRVDGKRTIETQQRYGTDMEATILVFDTETKTASLGGTKEEDDILKVSEAILEFLKSTSEPVNEPDIDAEVEGRTGLKRKALRELVAKGQITRHGAGKRNDPYLYSCSLVPAIYGEQEKQEEKIENKELNGELDNGAKMSEIDKEFENF